ncbi:MAG: hypothetical protein EA408_03950 [Marinilabiliales bacterium]|nr:MAG: hypothetical protein EA408_03950 [Marinilabiliales bacterium]
MIISRLTSIYIFLFFVVLIILNHIFGYFGHYGYDDMLYSRIARNFLNGVTMYDNSFSFRFTIILLTSLSYLIFGISDFSSSLPSLLISVSILYIVYDTLKKFSVTHTVIGLSLTLLINVFLFYTDKIMPDIYVAFFLLLSIYWIDRYRFYAKTNELKYAFLFSVSLFLAFSSKETAVLFLPLPFVLFATDILQKRNLKFWIYSIILGVCILTLYLITIWLLTGDFFKRFEVLSLTNQAQSYIYSYDKQPLIVKLKRLFYDLFETYTIEGILVSYLLIISAFFAKNLKELLKINNTFSLYFVSSVTLLLSANFMTISPFSYHPVPTDPRHTLFLIPIAAIAASFVLTEFIFKKKYKYQITGLLVLISIFTFIIERTVFYTLYFPLSVLFVFYLLINKQTRPRRTVFIGLFIIILSITPFRFFIYSVSTVKYRMQKEIVFQYFIGAEEKCYVFTDPMQKNIGNYYSAFDNTDNCKFVDYTNISACDIKDEYRKYLFLNWHTRFYSDIPGRLPFFAKHIDSSYVLIFENSKHGIYIYEIPEIIIPELSGKKLLQTKNDFQNVYENWTYEEYTLSEKTFFSGHRAQELHEFSASFYVTLDSLEVDKNKNLYIKTGFQWYFSSRPSSMLVFSIEDDEGVYSWESRSLGQDIRVFNTWHHLEFDLLVKNEEIKSNSVLKIYIWNPDNDKGYIDDFEIFIYEI